MQRIRACHSRARHELIYSPGRRSIPENLVRREELHQLDGTTPPRRGSPRSSQYPCHVNSCSCNYSQDTNPQVFPFVHMMGHRGSFNFVGTSLTPLCPASLLSARPESLLVLEKKRRHDTICLWHRHVRCGPRFRARGASRRRCDKANQVNSSRTSSRAKRRSGLTRHS